jgi:hypothetical protein
VFRKKIAPYPRNRKIFRRSQAFRRSPKRFLLANKTYVRGNNSKKKIEQADFPAEAPESSCHKRETANAERSLHDLSSESSKECSLAEISESCDPAKNDRGSNQEKKHSAPTSYSKKVIVLSRFLRRQQALCQNAKFSDPNRKPSMKTAARTLSRTSKRFAFFPDKLKCSDEH